MAAEKTKINPFYFLLGIMGFIFTITAVLFTLVTLRSDHQEWRPAAVEGSLGGEQVVPPENGLLQLMREDGTRIFMCEIGIIAVLTVGAIGLDRYRDLKNAGQATPDNIKTPDN